jgi:hypothetical protein
MRRLIIGLALGAVMATAQAVTAATLTWNTCAETCSFGVTSSVRSATGSDPANTYTFATVGTPNLLDPSKNLEVRGYRTPSTGSPDGTVGMGPVTRTKINLFTGGLGLDSLDGSAVNEASPAHAVDNNGADEFLVFKLPSNGMWNVGFTIGYKSGDADITVWLGGQAGTAAQGDAFALLDQGGFEWNQGQPLVALGYKSQTFLDVPTNSPQTLTVAGAAGRYLIIGAQHECATPAPGCTGEHGEDYFKLMSVVANHGPTPPSSVPYPGSLAMVGAGFIAVAAIRRFRR